ncbi:MAG: tetratricopeptide repeat protein [Deltaproteobacteria bacterium]|jgi:cytochrome c-type biogenesis protein CcmH/NrfG|nr:tetratricopeptide repeat protein [Deltaproteobacteria bacterium]
MNEHVPARGMQRVLLLFLAFAFLGMTAVSLWQRIMQPDLVVPADARRSSAEREEAPEGSIGEIGRLMQQVRQNPGDAAALLHLAEHLVEEKNWEAAENFLRRAVVAAPGNPQPLYLLGVVLHNRGQHAEAAACLERVVNLRDEPSVRYSLGVLYAHYLQDRAGGIGHLRAALAQPGLPDDLAGLIRAELDVLEPRAPSPRDADGSAKAAPSPAR